PRRLPPKHPRDEPSPRLARPYGGPAPAPGRQHGFVGDLTAHLFPGNRCAARAVCSLYSLDCRPVTQLAFRTVKRPLCKTPRKPCTMVSRRKAFIINAIALSHDHCASPTPSRRQVFFDTCRIRLCT